MFGAGGNVFKPEFRNLDRRQFVLIILIKRLNAKFRLPKTDKERFTLALKELLQHDDRNWYHSTCDQKRSEHSIKLRNDGNESFGAGQYERASQEYTESAVYAADSSVDLALAFANRSAALFKLKKYEDCIKDVNRALNLGYPDKLKTKLFKRKGLCLMRLGSPEADSLFQEALVWLDKMTLSEDETNKNKRELENLISALPAVAKPPTKFIEHPVARILAPNPVNPSASDAVTIKYSEKFGRHLVATRRIEPGELLISEKPYCSRLKCKHIYTHCSHCLQESWSLIPCRCCVNVTYCTETCRDQAWDEYHQVECPVAGMTQDFKYDGVLCIATKMAIMATQKGTKLDSSRKELEDIDGSTDPLTKGFTNDGKFPSNQHRSVYSLRNTVEKCSSQEVWKRSLTVAVVVCALAGETIMFGKKLDLDDTLLTNPDVIFVGELILKHLHIIASNVHSYGPVSTDLQESFACGLVPFVSLLNHSCDPNTVRKWNVDRLTIYAVYPIEEGEQIFGNYGVRFCGMSRSERHEKLQTWNFTCECRPCVEDWPQFNDICSYKEEHFLQKSRNTLDGSLRKFRVAYSTLTLKRNLENLTNLLNVVLEAIAALFNLAQRPCKELCMLVFIVREYFWSGRPLFDYVSGNSGSDNEMTPEVAEFYKSLQEMDEHLSTYRLKFFFGLVTSDLTALGMQCKNDDELFTLALKIVVQNSAILLEDECEQKDSQHSIRSREDGNQSSAGSQYYKATKEYTESIVYAQSPEGLALAYADRSAALYELDKFEECVRDIDRALSLKHPERLKTKLYQRKGLCLKKIGRPGAVSLFKKALALLDKTDLSEAEMNKSKSELSALILAPGTVSKVEKNVVNFTPPEILTPSPEIPSASDAVAIEYSEKFGRHLVATREIKPGEILVSEKPYCSRLTPKQVYTHCSHCLQVSWDLIPCKYCVNVAYCSNACKDTAWDKYHEVECPVVGLLLDYQFNDVIYISLRAAIIAIQKGRNLDGIKEELLHVDHNADPRSKGFSDDGKFHSDQYRSVYSLKSDVDECATDELLLRALFVALTVCMVAGKTKLFKKKLTLDTLVGNPDVIFVGGLILKHVHRFWLNTHSFSGSSYEHGHTLLPVFSLLNHSCDANTFIQCYRDCMALYATYPINRGEQIFCNYGPRSAAIAIDKRRDYLARYHFTCDCLPCTENWPQFENFRSYKIQPLTLRNRNHLNKVLRKFCVHTMEKKSPIQLNELSKIIELLFELAQRPCIELALMVSMLKNYFQAAETVFDYQPGRLSEIAAERSSLLQALQRQI